MWVITGGGPLPRVLIAKSAFKGGKKALRKAPGSARER